MDRQRLLLVSAEPLSNFGGVGRAVQWLAADLRAEYRVSLAAPDGDTAKLPEELAPALENRFAIPGDKWTREATENFARQVEAGGYDLVHFHGQTFSFAAHIPWRSPLHALSRAGRPWVYTNHCAPSFSEGLFPANYPAPARLLKTMLAWWSWSVLLRFCRQLAFSSDENRGQIGKWFPWAKGKMRTVYHSGLEGAAPSPRFAAEAVIIGNLGHLAWRKGQHDLLAAFALAREKRPNLRLVLAGPPLESDCVRWLNEEIARRKLEGAVAMPGGISDKRKFWADVDIYVQPSRFEGAPMSLMEALWQGKPCIGTRVSGIPEMIDHDVNGLLVEAGKPEELAAALERLIAEPETRRRFGGCAAAQLEAKGMTRHGMSGRYAAMYEAALGAARG